MPDVFLEFPERIKRRHSYGLGGKMDDRSLLEIVAKQSLLVEMFPDCQNNVDNVRDEIATSDGDHGSCSCSRCQLKMINLRLDL